MIKKVIIFLFVAGVLFFAFYERPFTLEGDWIGKEIVLNGKKINVAPVDDSQVHFIYEVDENPNITINDWSDSLYISAHSYKMSAKVKMEYNEDGKSYMIMSSNENALNGKFDLIIDTIRNYSKEPKAFRVDVIMKSKNAYLYLQREVYPQPPKKVPLPRRGAV